MGGIRKKDIVEKLQGWFGYAKWANTFNLREEILRKLKNQRLSA